MEEKKREHRVIMENREKITVSAVEDIESFDEEKVVIICDDGTMTVSGENFRINKLNVDDGQLEIDGIINEIAYSESAVRESGGFFGKLFR